jgi:hypothetical protein
MSFEADVRRFALKVETRSKDVLVGCANEVQRSVVEGSELTGAPGQPVDTGALKASWVGEFTGPWEWETTTNLEYAPGIENAVGPNGPITQRSEVGGFHSVALTRGGWRNIVAHVNDVQVPK